MKNHQKLDKTELPAIPLKTSPFPLHLFFITLKDSGEIMKDTLLAWLEESGPFAFLISLLANTAISLLAFVPSVFVTAANLSFFGLINGLILSFSGEVIGVMVSFYVYRKGFRFLSKKTSVHSSSVLKKLSGITEKDAFLLSFPCGFFLLFLQAQSHSQLPAAVSAQERFWRPAFLGKYRQF